MSQYFEVHPENPQPRLLKQAAQILHAGGVCAVPTDSSYALVCHLDDKAAADALRRIRGVDDKHHLTLLCRDLSELASYARVDNRQYRLLKLGTPGPYTFILEATKEVPRRLSHPSRRTIGLRVPDHRVTQELLAQFGQPLLATTLIAPGETEPMNDPHEIRARFQKVLQAVVDAGACPMQPTTVVDLTGRRAGADAAGPRRPRAAGAVSGRAEAARAVTAARAVMTISTFHCGLASAACTVARAGVWPGTTQCVPHRVHAGEVGHVGEEDLRAQHAALVGAGLGEQRVDRRQHLARLAADVHRVAGGHLTGEVDHAVVDRRIAHARSDVEALRSWAQCPFLRCVVVFAVAMVAWWTWWRRRRGGRLLAELALGAGQQLADVAAVAPDQQQAHHRDRQRDRRRRPRSAAGRTARTPPPRSRPATSSGRTPR